MATSFIPQIAETRSVSSGRRRSVNFRPVSSLAYWECVAEVVAELRAERPDVQLIDIAYWSRASQGSISRFEHKQSQPRNLDRLVVSYAKVLDIDPVDIMQTALDRWAKNGR